MAREHLEKRGKWQGEGVARGLGAEDVFHALLSQHLRGSEIETIHRPKHLKGIYGSEEIPRSGKAKGTRIKRFGIEPEYGFHHRETKRMVFTEIKRQRDKGNAHERACKYMMPGIIKSTQAIANQPKSVVPFWWIFTNGLANSPRYKREIQHWFQGMEPHFLLWENVGDHDAPIEHFERHIRPLLERRR